MINIKIFDNVLEKSLLEFIREEINLMTWEKHFSNSIDESLFFASAQKNLFSHKFLFNFFCKKYNLTHNFLRSYVNCHPPYSSGEFHSDDGDTTFLFYPDKVELNKGGTVFKDEKKIDYKSNRLIIFNARLLHKADKNLSDEMRHSIAWKSLI